MEKEIKKFGLIGIMFCFMLANVFALNFDIIEQNLFYTNTNKIETEKEFTIELTNRHPETLQLSYKSEFCSLLNLPEYIEQERIKVKGICEKSDQIIIYGNDYKINIQVYIKEQQEPPIEPPEIPEEPINTIKISSGRNLTQEGINRYGKENFYYILSRISMYSREYKLHNIYWKNSNIYDITYLCRTTEEGHKVYCILESINLNGDESDK